MNFFDVRLYNYISKIEMYSKEFYLKSIVVKRRWKLKVLLFNIENCIFSNFWVKVFVIKICLY